MSSAVKVLQEAELRELVGFGEAELAAIEAAFAGLAADKVYMPPIMHIEVADFQGARGG